MVRVWRVAKGVATMEASLKDHKGPVNCIAVKNGGGDEAASASSDGSCIIWDMTMHRRVRVGAEAWGVQRRSAGLDVIGRDSAHSDSKRRLCRDAPRAQLLPTRLRSLTGRRPPLPPGAAPRCLPTPSSREWPTTPTTRSW